MNISLALASVTPEEIDYHIPRGLDRSLIQQLLTGQWPTKHTDLWTDRCRQGFTVRYHRLSRLLQEMMMANEDRTYRRVSHSLAKIDLLILDDWGLANVSAPEARELLDILDDRVRQHSTCVVSQIPVELWHDQFSDATLADAVLDRLVHDAYRIQLKGDPMRKLMSGIKRGEEENKTIANQEQI